MVKKRFARWERRGSSSKKVETVRIRNQLNVAKLLNSSEENAGKRATYAPGTGRDSMRKKSVTEQGKRNYHREPALWEGQKGRMALGKGKLGKNHCERATLEADEKIRPTVE